MIPKERIAGIFDRINEFSLYGLIFFIPISNAGVETFFGFMMFSFIIKKICSPDFSSCKFRYNIFLLLFVFFMALSLVNSGVYIKKSIAALFFKWLEYITIFVIAQDVLSTPKRIRNSVGIFIFGAALVSIDGLTQKLWGIEFLRHRPMARTTSGLYCITGPFKHYNAFGAYLMSLTLMVIGLLRAGIARKIKFSLNIILTSLLICLLLTLSRGAWLGFLVGLMLMSFILKRFRIFCGVIAIILLALLVSADIRERAMFTFNVGGDATRFALWRSAIAMIRENPFIGKGLGTFMDHFSRYNYTANTYAQYAHNCFLQIWAETGIFSLVSFIFFVGTIIYQGIKQFTKNHDYISLAFACATSGFLVHSFFDTHLYSLQLAVLFWTLLGIIAAQNKLTQRA